MKQVAALEAELQQNEVGYGELEGEHEKAQVRLDSLLTIMY